MDPSKFFNLWERIKKYRYSVILIFALLIPTFASIVAGDSQFPTDKELAEVLEKAAHYCEQLEQTPLYFVCKEDVQEKINIPYSKDYRKFIYWTSDKAGGAYRKGQSKHYVYDYHFTRTNNIEESRVLLQEDNQKKNERNAPLKTKRFYHRYIFMGPVGLLSREAQNTFDYKILKRGKDTLVVETTPKSDSQPNQLFGKIWLDKKDGSVLKIEWKDTSLKNFQALKKDAAIYAAKVELYFFSEYKIQQNGLRFPSTYYVREQYFGKRFNLEGRLYPANKILRSEVKVKYQDYQFFEVEILRN